MGVVVVTHDLGLAWNIADRIAVMYLGRVVECGTTEEVLEPPEAPLHPGAAVRRAGDRAPRARRPHTARSPTPAGSRPAAASTPAAPSWRTAPPSAAGVAEACRTVPLEVLPATGDHRAACHLAARALDNHDRRMTPFSY